MEHFAPLLQTVLWVGLVTGILFRFHRPIHDLLVAVHKRIEAGSSVEVGPVKLGEVKPTPPIQQRQRAEAEIAQIVEEQLGPGFSPSVAPNDRGGTRSAAVAPSPPTPSATAPQPAASPSAATPSDPVSLSGARGSALQRSESNKIRSRFFLAEELALRAVQTEFNEPLNRQVSIGPGIEADGAFLHRDELYLVEVKYIVRPRNAASTVTRTLEHYRRVFGPGRTRTVTIVLALVFEHESDVSSSTLEFQELANNSGLRVQVRGYSLNQLQATYGVLSDEA